MKKLTTEQFIERAKLIHSSTYDYSKTTYVGYSDKLIIGCKKHGDFSQEARVHTQLGHGCPKCGAIQSNKDRTLTLEQFIKQAIKTHGSKYDYSKVIYKNSSTRILIICPEHGEFKQIPQNHLNGSGCIFCGIDNCRNKLLSSTESFIGKAQKIHGTKYNYSKSCYERSQKPLIIILSNSLSSFRRI
jgi:hypothetical protein